MNAKSREITSISKLWRAKGFLNVLKNPLAIRIRD